MGGGTSRSLGERLATSTVLVLLGAVAAVIGIVVFVTGKNLPDLVHRTPAHAGTRGSPAPSARRTATVHPSASRSARPSPTKGAKGTPSARQPGTAVRPSLPTILSLPAPSLAEMKLCFRQLMPGWTLSQFGLNDGNLGQPATLHIQVGLGDYTYQLIAADGSCQPETLVTVAPGQAATVHIYVGALWDFDYPGENWSPEGPSPTSPDLKGEFIFNKPTTTITATIP